MNWSPKELKMNFPFKDSPEYRSLSRQIPLNVSFNMMIFFFLSSLRFDGIWCSLGQTARMRRLYSHLEAVQGKVQIADTRRGIATCVCHFRSGCHQTASWDTSAVEQCECFWVCGSQILQNVNVMEVFILLPCIDITGKEAETEFSFNLLESVTEISQYE